MERQRYVVFLLGENGGVSELNSKQCICNRFVRIRPDQKTVTVVVQYLSLSISVANLLLL
jgi:hypothetical protein